MKTRILVALLLASAAARAERSWVFEPDQALVTVESRGHSAVSHGLSGRFRELGGGEMQVEMRILLTSFVPDRARPDLKRHPPEVIFEGVAGKPGKDGVFRLQGTLTLRGTLRSLEVPVTLVRAGGMAFGHASFSLHLRDFGFVVPAGIDDEAKVQIDAGMRPEGVLASRG